MRETFARAIQISESRSVKVSELPGGGLRIEGITRNDNGTWSQDDVCFSHGAIDALFIMLEEWKQRKKPNQ